MTMRHIDLRASRINSNLAKSFVCDLSDECYLSKKHILMIKYEMISQKYDNTFLNNRKLNLSKALFS